MSMDLTITTKRFNILCCDRKVPTIYIINKFNEVPVIGSRFYLTKSEMKELVNAFDMESDSKCEKLLRYQCIGIEAFMDSEEKAEFYFC